MASTVYEWDQGGNLIKGTVHGLNGTTLNRGCLTERTASGNFTAIPNSNYNITGFFSTINIPDGQPAGTRLKFVCRSGQVTLQFAPLNYVAFSEVASTLGGTLVSREFGVTIEIECMFNAGQIQWQIINYTGQWEISRSPIPYIIDQLGNQIQPLVKQYFQRDKDTAITVDIQNGLLKDFSGLTSHNYNTRQLISPDGSHVQIDYSVDQVVDLSPQSAPLDNLVKVNRFSMFGGFQGPSGVQNMGGFSTINRSVTGVTSNDLIFITPKSQPNGNIVANTFNGGISISSTASETIDVYFFVLFQH